MTLDATTDETRRCTGATHVARSVGLGASSAVQFVSQSFSPWGRPRTIWLTTKAVMAQ